MHRERCLREPLRIHRRRRNCTDGSVLFMRPHELVSQAFSRRVPNAAAGYFSSPQPRGKSNARHRGRCACPSTEHPNYSKKPLQIARVRLWCGRNRISPDDRREEPRSISTDRRSLPKAVARVVALCGVRMCRGKVKRADGTSASADAAKKNAPYGR